MILVYFDVSLDFLIKGDVDIMKHQVSQSQLKKWLILIGISFFIFSVCYPLRFLLDSHVFSVLLFIVVASLLYSCFQVFHLLSNQKLKTFTDILNFLDGVEQPFKLSREIWITIMIFICAFLIFFAGNVLSALIFWLEWL